MRTADDAQDAITGWWTSVDDKPATVGVGVGLALGLSLADSLLHAPLLGFLLHGPAQLLGLAAAVAVYQRGEPLTEVRGGLRDVLEALNVDADVIETFAGAADSAPAKTTESKED